MKQIGILPWQTYNRDGYGKLDLRVVVSEEFGTMFVRRHTPSEEHPGRFVSYHNENRTTGSHHADRADAVAEAERYFYAQPQFASSGQAKLLNAAIEVGKAAHQAGKSIVENPNPRTTVEASQWNVGWLSSYGNSLIAGFVRSIEPTMQANAQLEHDLTVATSRLQAWNVVFEFADILANGPTHPYASVAKAFEFLTDFRSGDMELMSKKWPGWSQFLHDKKLGPPVERDTDTTKGQNIPPPPFCNATGNAHSFGPHGPNGFMQCEYCGLPASEEMSRTIGDSETPDSFAVPPDEVYPPNPRRRTARKPKKV